MRLSVILLGPVALGPQLWGIQASQGLLRQGLFQHFAAKQSSDQRQHFPQLLLPLGQLQLTQQKLRLQGIDSAPETDPGVIF